MADRAQIKAEGNHAEVEALKKKTKYPYQVFLIVGNELCERFCYYGMRAVLSIYLVHILGKGSDNLAVVLYHTFISLCYFTAILGAITADTLLGKFKTILILSIVYALGSVLLSLAATPQVHLPQIAFSFLGLALIALGTGGIKPCVSTLGGDQFELPQQEKQLKQFFSVFYFSINVGGLLSTALTPELRNMSCLDMDTCFPLAFGVPALAMIVAVLFFVVGSPLYKKIPPKGNVLINTVSCIGHALSNKHKTKERKDHWLDYADDKFSKRFIEDVKIVLGVMLLCVPLPIFSALYDQQGSRWTLQAVQLNGRYGSFVLLPDQMQIINPILILLFIPLFEFGVYPLFNRCNILTTALQRMAAGGILAAVAFVFFGFLQMQLEAIAPVLPGSGEATITLMNSMPCNVSIKHNNSDGLPLKSVKLITEWETLSIRHISTNNGTDGTPYDITFFVSSCEALGWKSSRMTNASVFAYEGKAHSVLLYSNNNDVMAKQIYPEDQLDKSSAYNNGFPNVRIIYDLPGTAENYTLKVSDADDSYDYDTSDSSVGGTDYQYIYPRDDYRVHLNGSDEVSMTTDTFSVDFGGSYSLYVGLDPVTNKLVTHVWTLTDPNTISILWQFPQYFIITVAEILFSINSLQFSFSQAPISMKSVMSSMFLLTNAFGDLIDVVVIEIHFFDQISKETFFFAGLMVADMVVFMFIAYFYKYRDPTKDMEDQLDEGTQPTLKMPESGEDNPAFSRDDGPVKLIKLTEL